MFNAVIFDLDGTLYDYDRAHAVAFGAVADYAAAKLSVPVSDFPRLHREADRLLRRRAGICAAIHNRLIRYQVILEQLKAPLSHAMAMSDLYWRTLLDHMEASDGAADCLDVLRNEGYTIGVGTNMTSDWQFAKLERLGLLDRIDFLVTSEEVSSEKPEPPLFRLCAEKAGVPAARCAYVGDSLEHDKRGASAAGMTGILFCPAGPAPEEGPWVRRLARLPALLRELAGEQGVIA